MGHLCCVKQRKGVIEMEQVGYGAVRAPRLELADELEAVIGRMVPELEEQPSERSRDQLTQFLLGLAVSAYALRAACRGDCTSAQLGMTCATELLGRIQPHDFLISGGVGS